jgi:hypothetical protein
MLCKLIFTNNITSSRRWSHFSDSFRYDVTVASAVAYHHVYIIVHVKRVATPKHCCSFDNNRRGLVWSRIAERRRAHTTDEKQRLLLLYNIHTRTRNIWHIVYCVVRARRVGDSLLSSPKTTYYFTAATGVPL